MDHKMALALVAAEGASIEQQREAAYLLERSGDTDAAIQLLNRIRQADALCRDDRYVLARLYRTQGRLRAAEVEARTLVRSQLNDVEALRLVGELLMEQGNHRGAESFLQKLLAVTPEDARAYEWQGDVCHTLMEAERRRAILNYRCAAVTHTRHGRVDEAVRVYEKVMSLFPDDDECRQRLTLLRGGLE